MKGQCSRVIIHPNLHPTSSCRGLLKANSIDYRHTHLLRTSIAVIKRVPFWTLLEPTALFARTLIAPYRALLNAAGSCVGPRLPLLKRNGPVIVVKLTVYRAIAAPMRLR